MTIRVFEAFAGVGSQHMALKNIGLDVEVVGISEIDKYAIQSYESIHGSVDNYGDISKIDTKDLSNMDLFTYSFPCTDISIVGRQHGLDKNSGTSSSLLWECERIIKDKRPKYLLLENVKQLVGRKYLPHFEKWLDILEGYGYTNYWKVIDASHHGVPQKRERVFCVSILGGQSFDFPKSRELKTSMKDLMISTESDKYLKEEFFNRLDAFEYQKPRTTTNIKQVFAYNRPNRKNANRFRVYDPHYVMPTITTNSGGDTIPYIILDDGGKWHEHYIREINAHEMWRLMGFSDKDYEKASQVCSKRQLMKQAGNSIVVNVLEDLFKQMFQKELSHGN